MKKSIKLLLLAALAWPGWIASMAQEVQTIKGLDTRRIASSQPIEKDAQVEVQTITVNNDNSTSTIAQKHNPRRKADSNAPAILVQVDHEMTICDGTNTNDYVPVYGNYFNDVRTSSQWVYPNTMLQGIPKGSPITSVTFYATGNIPAAIGNAEVQVNMGEISSTTIANETTMTNNRNNNSQTVFKGRMSCSGKLMTITFSSPYSYQGGNLLFDIKVTTASNSSSCSWYGITATDAAAAYSYYYNGLFWSSQRFYNTSFLPKIKITYQTWDSAEDIDFGDVLINTTKELHAKINNPGGETITATMTATQPFGVSPSTLTMNPGETDFTLSFTPSQSINYTGNLNLDINGQSANIKMKGVGFKEGDKAIRDADFFHDFTYTWKENGVGTEHTGYLDSIATDPDQIIAMLREVYMNKNIPGNYKRGFTTSGADDHDNIVTYTGVGTINSSHQWVDSYGWNIEGDVIDGGTPYYYHYWYMDPNQYKPNQEGVTLLLLEMVDDFKYEDENKNITASTSDYAKLREYVFKAIKSARVITESKRTGSGFDAGTLFKIDCDKMNKFYLIAKGQLLWFSPTMESSYYTTPYNNPCYINSRYVDFGLSHEYLETCAFLGHMFEQFSPSIGTSSGEESKPRDDIYQDLVKDMETFGVVHDCPNVPYIGHHFMMYGENSPSADCADVRDMLFFVPDYRMMAHNNRASTSDNTTRDYFNYHPNHLPTMGVFVILQDAIPEGTIITKDEANKTGLYKHQLQWKSNLNKFLPSDDQYYELWEVVINDYGIEEYIPVYERNEDGTYVLENGQKKPIVLSRSARIGGDDKNNDILQFLNVYVDMTEGSQTKTYVIQGRDKGDINGNPFLSLQMSNRQSIVIPGTDANEKVRMIGTTHYSRYNPQTEDNCYSNKLQVVDNSVTESDLAGGLRFARSYRPALVDTDGNVLTDENGNIKYADEAITVDIATGTYTHISDKKGQLAITINDATQSSKDKFPKPEITEGETFLDVVGYHANPVDENNNLTFNVKIEDGKLTFENFYFWDNFTENVSKNAHPFQYLYKVYMGGAYSNNVPVSVFKTDSKINGAVTLADVLGDSTMILSKPGDVEFQALVQYGSKSELLRYDTYRWSESDKDRYIVSQVELNEYGNDIETDVAPNGQADNATNFYTVTMNAGEDLYNGDDVPVSQTTPRGWAKFVDYYPQKGDADAYDYVPVVETFNFGYRENQEANKWAERNDYNTYGGPMKNTAVGKLKVEVYPKPDEADSSLPLLSKYRWFMNNDWYGYYNILLKFTALDIPEGYELYKVRAWRKVSDKSILGEEVSTRASRAEYKGEWYMYEDMNCNDLLSIGSEERMSFASLNPKINSGFYLGNRSNKIAKPVNPDGTGGGPVFEADLNQNPNADNAYVEDLIDGEIRATFGALRLKNADVYPGSLDELNAEFKVRAYFTKNSNPLTTASSIPEAKPIYVLGNSNMSGSSWDLTKPLAGLYSENGTTYTGNVVINAANDEGFGYFSFSTKKASTSDGWDEIKDYRYGAVSDGDFWVNEENLGQVLALTNENPQTFRIAAGAYKLTVTKNNEGNFTNLVISKAAANAPRRAAMLGSDFDYYIAEGTAKFESKDYETIITGISGVKADLNREVVSVTYVNPLGQQSSRPFGGVNMVITRYSDGSATTTKVVK